MSFKLWYFFVASILAQFSCKTRSFQSKEKSTNKHFETSQTKENLKVSYSPTEFQLEKLSEAERRETLASWYNKWASLDDALASEIYYAYFLQNKEFSKKLFIDWYAHPLEYSMQFAGEKKLGKTSTWVLETIEAITKLGNSDWFALFADPAIFQNFAKFYAFAEKNSERLKTKSIVEVRSEYLKSLDTIKIYRGMVIDVQTQKQIGDVHSQGTGILAPLLLSGKGESKFDTLERWFLPRSEYSEVLKTWAKPLGPVEEAATRVKGGIKGFLSSYTFFKPIAESVGYWASGKIDLGDGSRFGTQKPENSNENLYIFELEMPNHVLKIEGPYFERAKRLAKTTLVLFEPARKGNENLAGPKHRFFSTGEHQSSYEIFLPFQVPSSYIKNVEKFDLSNGEKLPLKFVWE